MILPYIGLFLVFGCYCCYAEELCYSDVCKKYVKFVQENIDETVDPCENFYQFSCGNFLRNQHLGSNENRIGTADLVDKQNKEKLSELLSQDVAETDNRWVKNAKKLYASCINLDRVDKNTEPYMRDILKDLGGWPLVTGVENPREPVDLLKRIMKYGLLNFVDIGIGINPKKPDERIIKIQQPDSISYDYFVLDGYVEAYKSFLKAITGLLNPNNTINNDKDIDEMLELSKSFVKIQLTPAELSLTNSNNIEMELGVLEKTFPGFPFVEVVKSMFEEIHDVVINESEPISVDNWEYFEKMHSIFAEAIEKKPNVVKNYMLGNFFSGLLNDLLPEKYLNAKLILKKVLSGVTSLEPRNLFCVRTAQTLLPDEVGKIYASAFLGKEAKEEAIHMSSDILNQTLDIIKDADWMDTNSKAKAIDKATNIKLQVGYPDFYDNLTYIESSKQYTLNSDNLLENLITLLKYSRREEYSNLRKKVDDATGWLLSPSIMNAIYTFANNNIYVLAGILTPPFYNYKLPKYINYGSMGFTYGHEVTHAFDITGRRYDKNGKYFPDNEEGLWTFKTIEKFTEKVQCMIEQYSEFHDKEFNITVNGLLTLGENIADNGGMKAAFEAYKKLNLKDEPRLSGLEKYTQDQMFFIAFGQSWCELYKPEAKKEMMLDNVHTIEEFRVEGVVRNSDYFRQAFKCDDKNRTYKRCSVW